MEQGVVEVLNRQGVPATVSIAKDCHLIDLFRQSVVEFADSPAFSSLGHTLSFHRLNQLARQFASYLQQHSGLERGDRIAIQLPNLIQYPVVLLGSLMAGMVVVNTNPLYTPRELEHHLIDSGAKAIVVLANMADSVLSVIERTALQRVLVTEVADLHPLSKRLLLNGWIKYVKREVPRLRSRSITQLTTALQMGRELEPTPPAINAQDLAILQYTGGTTGVPKAVMLSHANLVANISQSKAVFGSYGFKEQQEVMVLPLPLYHVYAQIMSMVMLGTGNHAVLVPNPRDLNSMVKALRRYRASSFCGINQLFAALCDDPEFRELDFSPLKVTLSGGMALSADIARRWQAVTGAEIYEGYGLTESSPIVAVSPGGANQPGTVGIALPSTNLKILDEVGKVLPPGEPGELCVQGPQVMQGYWQQPEETAKVLDADGWLRTGDIALLQPDGFLKIIDRKKDVINVSGFKVYPVELESLLSSHPQVVECAAIGVPDSLRGESIKLYVVARDGLTEAELLLWCREHLTAYKVPRSIEFLPQLPRSTVGRVLRRELR